MDLGRVEAGGFEDRARSPAPGRRRSQGRSVRRASGCPARGPGARARAPGRGRRRRRRARRAARSRSRAAGRSISPARTYGRLAAIASKTPSTASSRSDWTKRDALVEAEPPRVRARHFERVGRDVGRDDRARRAARRASASATAPLPVPTSRTRTAARPAAHLDQQLGLRPRDQHARVDAQVDAAEALDAEDVGDRLARGAAARRDPRSGVASAGATRVAGDGDQRRARRPPSASASSSSASRRGASTPAAARRDRRRRPARARSRPGGHAHRAPLRPRRPAPRASARFSSACSAAVNSARSPSSTASRLCAVSLMRWSVTRPCGKL